MKYILATHTQKVQWYLFDTSSLESGFELTDSLNLDTTPIADSKDIAKKWAIELGLKTWRYVKI